MHDKRFIGTEFDYEEIAKRIGSEKSYALGAGSGAMSCLEGHCGELIINENLITNESKSIIAQIDENKKMQINFLQSPKAWRTRKYLLL